MILFIRHYYTKSTIERKIQTLTNQKILEIKLEDKIKFFENYNKFELVNPVIFTSKLKRTYQTAKTLGFFPYKKLKCFNELNLKFFDGLEYETFQNLSNTVEVCFEGLVKNYKGEIRLEFNNRVNNFLNHLNEDRSKNYIVFTHGIIMRWIYLHHYKEKMSLPGMLKDLSFKPLSIIAIRGNQLKIFNN